MYVHQRRFHEGDKWEVLYGQYKTLSEAQAALEKRPDKKLCRIAEEYTVVRYKAVKTTAFN